MLVKTKNFEKIDLCRDDDVRRAKRQVVQRDVLSTLLRRSKMFMAPNTSANGAEYESQWQA